MLIKQICQVVNGMLINNGNDCVVKGFSTDTRTLQPGNLYIALKGERYDGHQFLQAASEKGAAAAIISVSKQADLQYLKIPLIVVPDPLVALQQLAGFHRRQFNIPVIGVTGSTGKTTTKDMIASVLAQSMPVLKTEGNFNNEIGLPLTILKLEEAHRAAVVEMAMRGLGQIRDLCQVAQPTIGVITNISLTHYEVLGSQENIARAKGELLESLPSEGTAIVNGDDPWCKKVSGLCRGKVLYYGFGEHNHVRATCINSDDHGVSFRVHLTGYGQEQEMFFPVPGEHNVLNALAAVTVGYALGMDLKQMAKGLLETKLTGMRLEILELPNQITVINDTYNANPLAVMASLQVLESVKKDRSIAVLGDMLELGAVAVESHRDVGVFACRLGVDLLVTVGKLAKEIALGAREAGMKEKQVFSVLQNDQAVSILQNIIHPKDAILIKGSRGMQMETIVQSLLEMRW